MNARHKRGLVVAIDGPAGAGKSTVARRVADALGYVYLDTGAMYRAITVKALREGIPLDDAEALGALAGHARIEFRRIPEGEWLEAESPAAAGRQLVFLDGRDITADIRHPEVTAAVSVVSAVPQVREAMVRLQRRLAGPGGVVVDGRDIGTVVLPNADRKFFVTADLDERARRRHRELAGQGHRVSLEEVREQMARRDRMDSTRPISPLAQAPDAIAVDTTGRTVDQVVDTILGYCRRS